MAVSLRFDTPLGPSAFRLVRRCSNPAQILLLLLLFRPNFLLCIPLFDAIYSTLRGSRWLHFTINFVLQIEKLCDFELNFCSFVLNVMPICSCVAKNAGLLVVYLYISGKCLLLTSNPFYLLLRVCLFYFLLEL